MRADWALRLYPAEWKERYMSEVRSVLSEHPTTARTHADMLRGAADAWLQFGVRPLANASALVVFAAIAANLGLLGVQLARYPQIFGAERIPWVVVAVASVAFFSVIVVLAGRAKDAATRRGLRRASVCGLVGAAVMSADITREYLSNAPAPVNFLVGTGAFLAVLTAFGVAGAIAGNGEARRGAWLGTWAAMVCMLATSVYAWGLNTVLMARLEQILPNDPEFKIGNTLKDLPSYTVWNTIAAISSHAVLLPVLGAGCGAAGALLVASSRRRRAALARPS